MKGYYSAMLATVAVLAVLLAPALADGAEAATVNSDSVESEFDTDNGGYITFEINNSGGVRFTTDVTVTYNGEVVGTLEDVVVAAGETGQVVTVECDFTEEGSHTLRVEFSSSELSGFYVNIEVDTPLLSNWVTYAVIIIVVIIIIVFVYLKVRDSPKQKSDMTFEQLEEERKAEMAAKNERKNKSSSSGSSTERQMYLASKKKKQQEDEDQKE